MVVAVAVAALSLGGCGSDDEPQRRSAKPPPTTGTAATTSTTRPVKTTPPPPAADRYEGFVTGGVRNPTRADAKREFVGGNVIQFVFRDRDGAATRYQVCHRSDRGRSCREATSGARGQASIFPPLLANTDVLGKHDVTWSVGGEVVARASYTVRVEPDGPEGDAGSPGGNVSCGTHRTPTKGRYAVRVESFPSSTAPSCTTAIEIVVAYLEHYAPQPGQLGPWRCTQATGGDSASGTAFRVTCRGDGPGRVIGIHRGT